MSPSALIESLRNSGSDGLPEASFFNNEKSSVQVQKLRECGLGNLDWSRSAQQISPHPSGLERTSPSMLDDFNTPYNISPSGSCIDIFDWDLQSLRAEGPDTLTSDTDHLPLNSLLWIQEPGTSRSHEDQIASSDALRSMFHDLMISASQPEESLPALRSYLSFLWKTFVEQVCPFLTPFGHQAENPFLKHLVPTAAKCTSLFVAILHLAQTIVGRRRQEPLGAEARFLEDKVEDIQRALEERVSCESTRTSTLESPGEGAQGLLLTLSTTLVFCMGFLLVKIL